MTTSSTSTVLFNREARRSEKKKKKRTSLLDNDDDDDDELTSSAVPLIKGPVLLGGGESGYRTEVPERISDVAAATNPSSSSKQKKKSSTKEQQELFVDRTSDESVVGVKESSSAGDMPLEPGQKQPDVTTIVTDPDTGIARIQQGKYVMDKVTGKAVVLSSLGPEYRMAQMFPSVPPEIRNRYRYDWNSVTVSQMIDQLREACTVPLKDGITGREYLGIPPHPQISNPGVDFVLANRDLLGQRMRKALGRLKLRAQSKFEKEAALNYRSLWKHFLLLEDHISAPFRQVLLNAEANVGPNFGNLDVKSYCNGELYVRTANYLVLKSMVAHWEKKYNDALELEDIPETDEGMDFIARLYTGDPKRYLPNPPIIFRLAEVSRIVVMAQKMCAAFVDEPTLFNDLPPEVRFVERALGITGGTALRRYMLEEFCPTNNVDPASLREGLRRLYAQMFNMQLDPYADLTMTLWNLCVATAVGTDEARDPYEEYIANIRGTKYETNPGYFQTYTFDHDKNSLVRFLDSAKLIEKGTAGSTEDVTRQIQGEALQLLGFNFGGGGPLNPATASQKAEKTEQKRYVVPEDRAIGRPHMMGWLDLLGEDEELMGGSSCSGGNEEEGKKETFEADKWEEVKA
jgi:hypothetical protein